MSSSSSKSSSNSSRSSGSFPIEIVAKAVGIQQTTQQLSSLFEVIKQGNAIFMQSLANSTKFGQGIANLGRNFAPLNQGFNQGAQGAQRFNQALQQSSNTLRQGQTTLNQFMNTQRQTAQTAQQAAAAEKTLTTSTMQLNNTFRQTTTTLGQTQGQFMNLNNNMRQTSQSMNNAIANTVRYNSEMKETAGSTMLAGSAADQSSSSHSKLGDVLGGVTRTMTGTIMSTTMLGMSIQEAGGMSEMLAAQQAKVDEQTQILADTIKQYGAESKEAAKEQKELNDMTRGLSYTQRNANMAMGDAIFFIIMLSSSLGNKLIPALANWSETTKKLSSGWDKFTDILSALPSRFGRLTSALGLTTAAAAVNETVLTSAGAAASKNTVQIGALSTAQTVNTGTTNILSAAWTRLTAVAARATPVFTRMWIAITGPVGLAVIAVLAAISAALLAIQSDFLGVRTSIENFGVAVSDQIPILYPFGELLQGIGAKLGLTGESAEEASQHFENATTGFEKMGELWNRTIGSMQESSSKFVRAIGDTAAVLTTDFRQAQSDFQNQLKATTDTWNQFVDALSKGDFNKAIDIIIESLSALPDIVVNIFSHLGTQIYDSIIGGFNVLSALGEELKPYFEKAWDTIVGLATAAGTRIYNEFVKGLAPIVNWVQQSIIIPVQGFFNRIADGIHNVAAFVWDRLGFAQFIIWTTTIAKTVGGLIMGIVEFVKPIATEIWNKLQLSGLFNAAYQLGKDVWDQIVKGINDAGAAMQGALNTAFGQDQNDTTGASTSNQGTVEQANKMFKDSVNSGNDKVQQALNDILSTPAPTTTTSGNTTTKKTTKPSSVTNATQNDFGQMQQAFAPIQTSTPAPKPSVITPSNTGNTTPTPAATPTKSPYAIDFSKDIPKFDSGSGSTADFIAGQQKSSGQATTAIDDQTTKLKKTIRGTRRGY